METLEPSKDNRKKFDLDLAYGKVRENMVADMLQDKKIEVKSERDMWARTGNIALESQVELKPQKLTIGFTIFVLEMTLLLH